MSAWTWPDLVSRRAQEGRAYLEFVRSQALSAGIYHLAAGSSDPQQPHAEDEIYYVVSGQATIRVGPKDGPVGPGAIVYVPREVPHYFHSIQADLTVLVFFAPAESGGPEH